MTFRLIAKVILLIAALFNALGVIGAKDARTGEWCVVMSTMFTAALVALMVFEMRGVG